MVDMGKNKVANKDFQMSQLPKTRREQFFDLLKNRWGLLFKIGFILLLAFLPILAAMIYKDSMIIYINSNGYEDVRERLFSVYLIYSAFILISFLIFFIVLSGLMKIIKELIYGDPVFFKEDFVEGLKENWKAFAFTATIISIFEIVDVMISFAFPNQLLIQIIPAAINFVLVFPLCFVALFISSVYVNKISVVLKSAIIIYFTKFPIVLLCYIFTFGIMLLKYIALVYIKYSLLLVLVFVILPISILMSFEAHMHIFDESINKEQYPDYYKKGLLNNNK